MQIKIQKTRPESPPLHQASNLPIGIMLCAEKDEIAAEYILGGFDKNVFASKYTYVLPQKEDLIKALENIMNNINTGP